MTYEDLEGLSHFTQRGFQLVPFITLFLGAMVKVRNGIEPKWYGW